MNLVDHLHQFLTREARVRPGDGIVVGFSGGPDSTALLWGLRALAPRLDVRIVAAHLDHGLDDGSARRCLAAGRIAARLGAELVTRRRTVVAAGDGPEAAARRLRYAFLEEVRARRRCRFIATAHHRDDQAETVLLRMQFGSGPLGLAGIRSRRGRLLRPLLGVERDRLATAASAAGLAAVADPTNDDLQRPRNRLRHHTLPALAAATPDLVDRLHRLAGLADRARERLWSRLEAHVEPQAGSGGASASLERLRSLHPGLLGPAMALLHDLAGATYPPPAGAVAELQRQLAAGRGIGCDCGAAWRWEGRQGRLHLLRREPMTPVFTYTRELRHGRSPAAAGQLEHHASARQLPEAREPRIGPGEELSTRGSSRPTPGTEVPVKSAPDLLSPEP